jgi:cation diffusion facilitator family transporter
MTFIVLLLTAVTMVIEIAAGTVFGSMALLADGWHMGTHVAAFMITLFAYRYSRRHRDNPQFSFGTGKVNALGGFASAVALAVVALVMLAESAFRLINPHKIHFDEAIMVAILGLLVNLASAFLLKDHHHSSHDHHANDIHKGEKSDHQANATPQNDKQAQESWSQHRPVHDHNLRAAYLHVLADALTSLLAIVALFAGKWYGWLWMDPVMGMVGALIITRWSLGLIGQSSPILLDASVDLRRQDAIRKAIEKDADNRVSDLHIWQVGADRYAAIISLVTHQPSSTEHYKNLLAEFHQLVHVTIEVNPCRDKDCNAH